MTRRNPGIQAQGPRRLAAILGVIGDHSASLRAFAPSRLRVFAVKNRSDRRMSDKTQKNQTIEVTEDTEEDR
jgi:hypothetical protein